MRPEATATPRFAPYEKGRFQLTLGIREIPETEWIDVDRSYSAQMAEKKRLHEERHDDVFAALPESARAQMECLDAVLSHMTKHHPGLVENRGGGILTKWDEAELAREGFVDMPLALAGRLVQEDLCLMMPGPDGHRLIAASLCFPSRWRLADKIGRPMSAIHDPVPGFNARLNRPVERFFSAIGPEQLYMRLNWSVMDDPALFQPTGHGRTGADASITAANLADRLHIRIERQTFRRLPLSGALVFGIKTLVDPIAAIGQRPELAAGMLGSLQSMPSDMRGYKSLSPFAEALETWLKERAFPDNR